jgi:hypothetical protein
MIDFAHHWQLPVLLRLPLIPESTDFRVGGGGVWRFGVFPTGFPFKKKTLKF